LFLDWGCLFLSLKKSLQIKQIYKFCFGFFKCFSFKNQFV